MKLTAPTTPREVFRLFSAYKESEGIEALLDQVDWSCTVDQVRRAFLVAGTAEAAKFLTGPEGGSSADESRRLASSILRSSEFQTNLMTFVMQAFPEKLRLSFVHIPKCGGTTVNTLLSARFPWINDHIVDPAWTDQNSLFKALRAINEKSQETGVFFFSCHQGIRWFLAEGILRPKDRPKDRMFTVIRHPYDIVFSHINYIIKRFRQYPNLTTPDTKDWGRQIGLDRFDNEQDTASLKALGIKILDNGHLAPPDLLTNYLGGKSGAPSLDAIKQSGIEIISLDGLGQWLEETWGIKSNLRDNQSEPVVSMSDLDPDRRANLIKACAEEVRFYDYLVKARSTVGKYGRDSERSRADAFASPQEKYIGGPQTDKSAMLTTEQIAWGYRYLLGREPESDTVTAGQARNNPDWRSFRNSLLGSAEFHAILTSLDLPPKWVAADVFGGKRMIWLDLRDDFVSRGALVDSYETIESAFISALLRPGDVLLDIGANIGWFTLLASTLVGESGRVHAFEPRRPTVDYLRRSVAMNGLQSMVTVHEFELADREGEFRLAWKKNSRNPGHSYLVDREMDGLETIPIQLRTLDSLRLDKVDFVKLDVEGAEPKVLAGGRNTFETHRPIVLSELYPEQLRTVTGISPREYITKFRSMDYQAFMVDQHRASEAVDDFPSDFATELTNIALIPSEKLKSVAAMLVAAGIDPPKWSQRTRPNAAAVSTKPAKSDNNEGAVTREGGTVTREQIRDAYICVLGREPESEQAYQAHMEVKSITDLRYILMLSLEYRSLFQSILQAQERDTLVLIRMERTGGTTLHNILAANFTPDKVAPLEEDVLRSFSPFDSVKYDFFSGHCDYEIALAIPRPAKKFVSLFRKPAERLVSFYRFCRSQPPTADLGQKHPYCLANTLSAEDFFSHSAIRSWAKANNNYLRVFGTSLERSIDPTDERAALSLATERIKHLDAIGLTHRMDESVRIICKSLGFPVPERSESLPARHPQLENVPPVEMTAPLAKALEELISYDEIIYQAAVDEFERRLQAGGKSERPAAVSLKTARRSRR